jgi:hypothetical protein
LLTVEGIFTNGASFAASIGLYQIAQAATLLPIVMKVDRAIFCTDFNDRNVCEFRLDRHPKTPSCRSCGLILKINPSIEIGCYIEIVVTHGEFLDVI